MLVSSANTRRGLDDLNRSADSHLTLAPWGARKCALSTEPGIRMLRDCLIPTFVQAGRSITLLIALAPSLCLAMAQPELVRPATTAIHAPTEVAAIALPDIVARAEEEQQFLDRTRQLLATSDPVAQLRGPLDDIARTVDAKLHITTGMSLRELPVMRLESLARHWEFDARRFQRWEVHSRDALMPFSDSAILLAQHRAAWTATRAAGSLDSLPVIMSEHVDTILGQIDTTEAALGTAISRQFALAQRAGELKARIRAGQHDVEVAIEDIDRRLLAIDAPPLWRTAGTGTDAKAALTAMHYGLQIEEQFALDYHAARTGNQQALRLVQILLLPLVLWLFLRSRRGGGQHLAPGDTTRALRRPISVWLLLSMLAVVVLEPDAPLLVHEVALLLAIVPVIRLLPAGTLRSLGAWPYIAIVLYGLERLCVAAVTDSGWYRWLLLVLSVLAMGLTTRMLGDRRLATVHGARPALRRAVRALAWTVLAILLVAIGANVIGNVSLAEMLTSGVIDSGYTALLLYSGVNACQGIVRALLYQPELTRLRFARQHRAVIQLLSMRVIIIGATLGWLAYSADRFRLQRPLRFAGAAVMGLGIDVGEVSLHLGDVAVFFLATWIAVVLAKGVRRVLRDELPGHTALPRGVGNSIASLSYYGVLALGMLVALSAAGLKLSQFALVFGALGVGVGFGLQTVVNNFVSGLVLMFERPIQPGDIVDAAGASGTVRDIRLRSTTIRTFDGADVVVPNGLLLSGNLINWTMHDQHRRIEVSIDVAHAADPARVLTIMKAIADETPGVAQSPAPAILMTDITERALNFSIRIWTLDINNWLAVRSDLLSRIVAGLHANGIVIPYPQLDVHLRKDSGDMPPSPVSHAGVPE